MKKKLLSLTMAVCILMSIIATAPVTANAEETSKKWVYYVTGDGALCNGHSWDPKAEENIMTKQKDGSYEIVFNNVPKSTTPYMFNVTTNGEWEPTYNFAGHQSCGSFAEVLIKENNSTVKIVLTSELYVKAYVNDEDVTPDTFSCFNNLFYKFNKKTGVLTIFGEGGVSNYGFHSPWEYIRHDIKNIIIEEGVTSIGSYDFYDCSNLTSVTIPKSLTTINECAFENCLKISEFNIDEDNQNFSSIDGCLFNKDKSKLIFFGSSNKTDIFTIPNTVKEISNYAFINNKLKGLVLPAGLLTIGNYAFYCCAIENLYFTGNDDEWDKIYISDENSMWLNNIKTNKIGSCGDSISYHFFSESGTLEISGSGEMSNYGERTVPWYDYKEDIKHITIEEGISTIGSDAFCGCENLTDIQIPNTINEIGAYAFCGCKQLTDISISDNIKTIGIKAFENCKGLADEKGFVIIRGVLYNYYGEESEVFIPNSVNVIEEFAFSKNKKMEKCVIPDTVTTIKYSAFSSCDNLNELVLSNSVVSANWSILSDSSNVKKIYFSGTKKEWEALNIYVSSDVELIFSGTETGKCGEEVYYSYNWETGVLVISGNGPMYDYNSEDETPWFDFYTINELIIKDGVTSVGNFAFCCRCLTKVKLADTIKRIGISAFEFNDVISLGVLPKEIEYIDDYAFYRCRSISTISIPKGIKYMGKNVFDDYYYPVTIFYHGTFDDWSEIEIDPANMGIEKSILYYIGIENCYRTTLSLSKYSANLYVKGTAQIKATVKNGKGKTTYKSSNTKVAKVSSTGKVTAVKAGTAKITVTNNGVKKTFTVKVQNPKLNKTSVTLKKNKSFTLKITGKIGKATFTSSNKKIATVNVNGKIVAKKKGSATITVKTNGITLKCKVKVK